MPAASRLVFSCGRGVLAGLLALPGCASPTREPAHSDPTHDDAGEDAGYAAVEEHRPVDVTLWPFWELPLGPEGFEAPIPLGGVELCVVKRRPFNGKWEDFVDADGPCTTTVAEKKPVLAGVPGTSELVITAEKDGYQRQTFAVVTWHLDSDMTIGTLFDWHSFSLVRRDARVPWQVAPGTGSLEARAVVCSLAWHPVCGYLGGASVEVGPAAESAPRYFVRGQTIAGANSTTEVPLSSYEAGSGAAYTGLLEGEYTVRVRHPGASCTAVGPGGDASWGFPGIGGAIRAPIFSGTVTRVVAYCQCLDVHDPTCGWAGTTDAGTP